MDAESLRSAGWSSLEGTGFTSTLGLIWRRGQGPELTVGFLSDARHCNNDARIVHGGALMTFADIGLGFGVAKAHGATNLVTAHLQMNFVAAAPVGAFISVRPEIVRKGAQLIFVRGLLLADDKTVASADGMWKVLEPRK